MEAFCEVFGGLVDAPVLVEDVFSGDDDCSGCDEVFDGLLAPALWDVEAFGESLERTPVSGPVFGELVDYGVHGPFLKRERGHPVVQLDVVRHRGVLLFVFAPYVEGDVIATDDILERPGEIREDFVLDPFELRLVANGEREFPVPVLDRCLDVCV